MPASALAVHGALLLVAVALPLAIGWGRPRAARAVALGVVALVALQCLAILEQRRLANAVAWPDLACYLELVPQLAAALGVAAVLGQRVRAARLRTAVLALALFGASGWRAIGVLRPTAPRPEAARVSSGTVLQSAPSSCAAAAAATLLRATGRDPGATEADLARLCLTDARRGTSDLGLRRGLALATGRPVRFEARTLETLRGPCIVFVGLDRRRAGPLYEELRDRCNWEEGVYHAVVLLERAGDAFVVADPRYGLERWPGDHFRALWDGTTLEVH